MICKTLSLIFSLDQSKGVYMMQYLYIHSTISSKTVYDEGYEIGPDFEKKCQPL